MSQNDQFLISDWIFEKLLKQKKEDGFENETWENWLIHVCNIESNSKSSKEKIEQSMENLHYKSFNEWVTNFALNLNHIWNDSSARDLDTSQNSNFKKKNQTAIVIGRGPSLKQHDHLKLLANSEYKGNIVCTDGALISALSEGVTPEKFPNFFVVTIDPVSHQKKVYDNPIVDKYGSKIKGIFTTIVNPSVVSRVKRAGIKVHWVHSLFDYNEGKKSFNQISALITRAKNHIDGLPGIQTGGNVGTAAWFISWQILKCSTISLIGIDHGWKENDPLELIMAHGSELSTKIKKTDPQFSKFFPKIYNPDFDCYCILDPIFQFYSNALKEFISRSPSWVTTINATEGGCIFGKRIKCLSLKKFLQECQI